MSLWNVNKVLVILAIVVCSTSAFISPFRREERIAASNGRAVNESCLAKADAGDCGFYSCFEQRLPCGRDWYIHKQGLYYCNKINRMMGTFQEDIQEFLRESQTCLMQSLKDVYREDIVSCHDLEHLAVDAISTCYLDNAFCNRLRGNYAQFFSIYEVSDLLSTGAGKVWREIADIGRECGVDAFQSITAQASQAISGAVDSMVESVRSRWQDIFGKK